MEIKVISDGLTKKSSRTFTNIKSVKDHVLKLRDEKGQLFLGLKKEDGRIVIRCGYPIIRTRGHVYYQMVEHNEISQYRL